MAWADVASNQIPTFTDLQTSGFSLNSGQSAVTSNQNVNKLQALTIYNLSSTAMSSYANNQLVPKSAYTSGGGVVSYSFSVKLGTTTTNVCSASPVTIYSDFDTWGSGEMGLWYDAALTNGVSGFNYAVLQGETLIYNLSSSVDYQYLNGTTSGNCSTLTDVIITACGTNPDGSGEVTLYAYSSIAVDTNVSVQIQWSGDLFTELTGTVVISNGLNIGSTTVSPTVSGEQFGGLEILSITPASSSTQNYIEGSVSGGTCAT